MSENSVVRGQLEADLVDFVGWASVDEIAPDLFRVLLPSSRMSHDPTLVTVQWTGSTWRITDAGDVSARFGADAASVAELLTCAGGDFIFDSRVCFTEVRSALDVTTEIVRFAYYLSTAPVVWRARDCVLNDERPATLEPSVILLARETKAGLIARCGDRYGPFIRLRATLTGTAGVSTRVPMVVSTATKAAPRLLAAFIDTTASPRSVTAAKKDASFVIDVARDFSIPKFLVVRGDADSIDQMAQFYDRSNVVVTEAQDLDLLAKGVRDALPQLS